MTMSFSTFVKYALPFLSAAGYYCLWVISERNGLFDQLRQVQDADPPLLPGTDVPIKRVYTGIAVPVDHYLATLVTLFWPAVDGSSQNLSLHAYEFAGQVMAMWILLGIETRRLGNRGKIISLVSVWGILMQALGFTVIFPLYLALYMWTSPAMLGGADTNSPDSPSDLLVPVGELQALPVSSILGFLLPTILQSLPSPAVTSYETHQIFMSIWQVFPVVTGVLQPVVRALLSRLLPSTTTRYQSAAERKAHVLGHLRAVYVFAIFCAAIPHIGAWTLSLSSVLFPTIFTPAIVPHLHPRRVFLPPAPNSSNKMSSMGDGLLALLLYDEYIGSLAATLWAISVNQTSSTRERTWSAWSSLIAKVVVLAIVAGPCAPAIWLLWDRDEQALRT